MTDPDQNTRERAYALWEAEGRPVGRERDHWDRAERELGQHNANRTDAEDAKVEGSSTPADEPPERPSGRSRSARTVSSGSAKRLPRTAGRKDA